MLFNSTQFPVFFVLFFLMLFLLPQRARGSWILAASAYFYCAMAAQYLWVLLALILSDYALALVVSRLHHSSKPRLRFLVTLFGISLNFAALLYFKALHDRQGSFLPPGLSFHTFQSVAYLIEVNSGRFRAETSIFKYAQYILFWPQLVAGPIERPQGLLQQIRTSPIVTPGAFSSGAQLMLLGAIKKCVIADRLASFTSPFFQGLPTTESLPAAVILIFLGFEFYCDFSGYTDIARGAARMMGFDLVENFRQPLLSRSPLEFWRRWHMSLTSWFRDYVYEPILAKYGKNFRHLAVLLVFVLIGLWHALRPTMVLWGIYQALVVSVATRFSFHRLGPLAAPATFVSIAIGFGFFKSPTVAHSLQFYSQLLNTTTWNTALLSSHALLSGVAVILLSLSIDWIQNVRPDIWTTAPRPLRLVLCQAAVWALLFGGVFEQRAFIYFQF